MTDAASVHVFAHEPVPGNRIGESGIASWDLLGCAHYGAGAGTVSGQPRRLPCPGKQVRFERAGKEIEQAERDLVAGGLRDVVVALAGDCGGKADRQWNVIPRSRFGSFRHGRIGHRASQSF